MIRMYQEMIPRRGSKEPQHENREGSLTLETTSNTSSIGYTGRLARGGSRRRRGSRGFAVLGEEGVGEVPPPVPAGDPIAAVGVAVLLVGALRE